MSLLRASSITTTTSQQETLSLLRALGREFRKQKVKDVAQRTRELMELTRLNRNVNEEQAQTLRRAVKDYLVLLQSGRQQQELFAEYNIGQEISQSKRIEINARRVGLGLPKTPTDV